MMIQPIGKLCLFSLTITLLLTSCGNFLKPHKINVQQGNIITIEMLNKLELGMSKKQAEYILGTPLIVDTFTPDQWYYYYSLRLGSGETLIRSLTLNFADGKLSKMGATPPINKDAPQGKTTEPVNQILQNASEKLEKSLPDEIDESQAEAGL